MNRARMQACFLATSLRIFVLVMIAVLPLQVGCDKATANVKGAAIPMETYYIGRFSIAVPTEMKQAAREHKLRDTQIRETVWPKGKSHEESRMQAWDSFMLEVEKLKPPKGMHKVVLKTHNFPDIGEWAKGIFYCDREMSSKTASWKMLMDLGSEGGVWFKTIPVVIEKDIKSNNAINNLTTIGKAYRVIHSNAARPKGDWFYLQHGVINLPYKWQERSYVRFEGHPLKFTLEVKMNETYKVEPGINERTTYGMTNILGKYVTGVSVDRLRSRKREAAGLAGEEEILRIADKYNNRLYFHWAFAGKENSGEYPEINVEIETPDSNLDEKLKIWDAVLNSMQPMYK